MSRLYPKDFRDRAVRMVVESRKDHETVWSAIQIVASRMDVSSEALRRRTSQADVDAGVRPGVSTAEQLEILRLKKENQELRRAKEILRTASDFFAAELDRPVSR